MTELTNFCPCCSLREYDLCCKPFHEGVLPENALQLMRSRYAAYVLNMPDYIVATTHPASPQFQTLFPNRQCGSSAKHHGLKIQITLRGSRL